MTNRHCPVCAAPTDPRHAPFCSRRCGMKDLAHWIGAAPPYVIEGEPANLDGAEAPDEDSST